MRIVSLIPAGTEMLGMIGALDCLVGRSHECDHPPGVASLPVVTAPKTPSDAHLDPATAAYAVDINGLMKIGPDMVLTHAFGPVDAESVRLAVAAMDRPPKVIELQATSIEEIFDELLMLGKAIGLEDNAVHAVVNLKQRMDRAQEHINPYVDGPVVGFLQGTDPMTVAGHWTVQLIERAGGQHPINPAVIMPGSGAAVGPQQAQRIAGPPIAVDPKTFADSKPEYLVIAPHRASLAQAKAQADRLFDSYPWFHDLPAVKNNRVAIVGGNRFNRPGPCVVDAQEFLIGWLNNCEHLIPDGFRWEPYT